MKQTTIKIDIEEHIFGALVRPLPARKSGYQYSPKPEEQKLWEQIVGEADWHMGKEVQPKPGEPDNADWWKMFGERVLRVCANRPEFKTKVRVVKAFPSGTPRTIAVTAFWDRPKKKVSPLDEPGIWTLREFKTPAHRRGKILWRGKGDLLCSGDYLYDHLPDGDIPEGYDTFPDCGSVWVGPKDWREKDTRTTWEFRFKRTINTTNRKARE